MNDDESSSPGTASPASPAASKRLHEKRLFIAIGAFVLGAAITAACVLVVLGIRQSAINSVDSGREAPRGARGAPMGLVVPESASTPATDAAASVAETTQQVFSGGMYLVGTDIPEGLYQGTTLGAKGSWAIVADPDAKTVLTRYDVAGRFYVVVRNGQYLELWGAQIRRITSIK